MNPSIAAGLGRAKARLDRLDYYPEPVRIERVRVVVAPWFFRIPGFRRYAGYALWRTILLKQPEVSDDLLTHELCHLWQGQHRPIHVSVKHAPDDAVPEQPVRARGPAGGRRNPVPVVGARSELMNRTCRSERIARCSTRPRSPRHRS